MVREVVVDAHAPGLAEQVLATPDALEEGERRAQIVHARAEPLGARRDRGDRVAHVVTARDAQREAPARDAAREEIEGLRALRERRRRSAEPGRRHVARVVPLERVEGDPRARLGRRDLARARIARVAHHEPALGHAAHELAKGGLVRRVVG